MVDRITQSPSRIPVPVSSKSVQGPTLIPVPVNSPTLNHKVPVYGTQNIDQQKHSFHENGLVNTHSKLEEKESVLDAKKDKGFETFVMTGDMIIRTTSSQKTRGDSKGNRNTSDSTDTSDTTDVSDLGFQANTVFIEEKGEQEYSLTKNNQVSTESGFEDQGHLSDTGTLEREKDQSHATGPSSVSDLSMVSAEDLVDMTQSQYSAVSSGSDIKSDISEQTVLHRTIDSDISPSTDDSNSRVISPELQKEAASDTCSSSENEKDDTGNEKTDLSKMVTSKSAEKFVVTKSPAGHQIVRSSKSQELQSEFSLVAIEIDSENKAYSLDQIPQHAITNSTPSLESVGEQDIMQTSRSLDSSPEHKTDRSVSDKEFIPGFISLGDKHMKKAKTKDGYFENGAMIDSVGGILPSSNDTTNFYDPTGASRWDGSTSNNADQLHRAERDSLDPSLDPNLLEFQPLIKGVDQPSAHRLAKRLYNLDGFRKSDVSRHLSKKNDFGNLVAEEYLKFFNLESDSLDVSLRKFLKQFCLIGETQERERVLAHFSKRYIECNPGIYNSEDACHTLTCAIMLLNTDLHGQTVGRKMSCSDFIENLSDLNDGENFPKELLKSIYYAIKSEPIEWAVDEEPEEESNHTDDRTRVSLPAVPVPVFGQNPFLDVPDPAKTTEYKNGYVMRKCCMDSFGHRTALGKRSWKMFYVCLRDMIMYLYKDQHGMKKGQLVEGAHNAIRVHHCLASKASDYTKKQHVFRVETAEGGEYLFQTSDSKELQEWIDTINYVSASLSAPQLPGAVGSQKKFQRPLLPVAYTRYNLQEQLRRHEDMSKQVELDLQDHRQYPPEKGSKARVIHDYIEKESYLEHELKRYKTYVYLLQSRLSSFSELEPSLVETVIGEDEENSSSPPAEKSDISSKKPVQRSLSDRTEDLNTLGTLV